MVARVIHCKKCGMECNQYKDGYCKDCYPRKYHVHAYDISLKAELDIEANNPKEAKEKALDPLCQLQWGCPDCRYIALTFPEDKEVAID